MKITELRCPKCSGTLKIDGQNPNIAECEYCRTRYALEREGDDARLGAEPPKMYYQPVTPVQKPPKKKTGWEPYGWKRGVALVVGFFVFVGVFWGPGVLKKYREMSESARAAEMETGMDVEAWEPLKPAAEVMEAEQEAFTGILGGAVERILGGPADTMAEEQLSTIKWLEMKYSGDYIMIGYSLEDPYENPEAGLEWLEFDRDEEMSFKALPRLTGLKKLKMSGVANADELRGLHLTGLICYGGSFTELAARLDYPEELRELGITAGLESLEGLDLFPNVGRLEISSSKITDVKELVNAKNVKSLTIDIDGVSDFSVLSVMPWLEELSIESEALKDIGFVASMPKLRSLSLIDTSLLGLGGLEARQDTLTALYIDGCGELKDCQSISSLSNLKNLTLDLPYGCKQPDLGGLAGLESLDVAGFDNVNFLGSLTALKSLSVTAYEIDRTDVFAGLTSLEDLKCSTGPANMTKLNFITKLPALKNLDLTGASTYYDISGIFNMPTLESLKMDGMECEINFDRLKDNETLKYLSMDGVKLYKNAQISGGNGFYSIDYDDVSLDGQTGFVSHYPNLEYLSIGENNLTKVDFAAGLGNLKTLDIHENYITDLKPLAASSSLRQVTAAGNPISNDRVLPERVNLVK